MSEVGRIDLETLKHNAIDFTNTAFMSRWIEHFVSASSYDPTFLLSFPRSGNGYVRVLLAKVMLAARGIDPEEAVLDTYTKSTHGVPDYRFRFDESGKHVLLDDVLPDIYYSPIEDIASRNYEFAASSKIIIKTHHAVPDGRY